MDFDDDLRHFDDVHSRRNRDACCDVKFGARDTRSVALATMRENRRELRCWSSPPHAEVTSPTSTLAQRAGACGQTAPAVSGPVAFVVDFFASGFDLESGPGRGNV